MTDKEHKETARERRQAAKALGICVHCLKRPASSGYATCPDCRDQMSVYSIGRRELMKHYGICSWCGRASARPGKTQCPECAARNNDGARKRRQRYLAEGRCGTCGRALPPNSEFRLCSACRERARARKKQGLKLREGCVADGVQGHGKGA